MSGDYRSFDSMMTQDGEAKRYYESLPLAAKEAVCSRTEQIHSFDSLRNCVESILDQHNIG